jgi:mono/diheme cytochrome c family protein
MLRGIQFAVTSSYVFRAAAEVRSTEPHPHIRKGEAMKHVQRVMLGCLALAATAALGQTKSEPQQHSPPKSTKAVHTMNPDRGQQVFNQNCSRCHNAPEGFSPSISGTIAMHMRVRANLSDADYKALLRFLNP